MLAQTGKQFVDHILHEDTLHDNTCSTGTDEQDSTWIWLCEFLLFLVLSLATTTMSTTTTWGWIEGVLASSNSFVPCQVVVIQLDKAERLLYGLRETQLAYYIASSSGGSGGPRGEGDEEEILLEDLGESKRVGDLLETGLSVEDMRKRKELLKLCLHFGGAASARAQVEKQKQENEEKALVKVKTLLRRLPEIVLWNRVFGYLKDSGALSEIREKFVASKRETLLKKNAMCGGGSCGGGSCGGSCGGGFPKAGAPVAGRKKAAAGGASKNRLFAGIFGAAHAGSKEKIVGEIDDDALEDSDHDALWRALEDSDPLAGLVQEALSWPVLESIVREALKLPSAGAAPTRSERRAAFFASRFGGAAASSSAAGPAVLPDRDGDGERVKNQLLASEKERLEKVVAEVKAAFSQLEDLSTLALEKKLKTSVLAAGAASNLLYKYAARDCLLRFDDRLGMGAEDHREKRKKFDLLAKGRVKDLVLVLEKQDLLADLTTSSGKGSGSGEKSEAKLLAEIYHGGGVSGLSESDLEWAKDLFGVQLAVIAAGQSTRGAKQKQKIVVDLIEEMKAALVALAEEEESEGSDSGDSDLSSDEEDLEDDDDFGLGGSRVGKKPSPAKGKKKKSSAAKGGGKAKAKAKGARGPVAKGKANPKNGGRREKKLLDDEMDFEEEEEVPQSPGVPPNAASLMLNKKDQQASLKKQKVAVTPMKKQKKTLKDDDSEGLDDEEDHNDEEAASSPALSPAPVIPPKTPKKKIGKEELTAQFLERIFKAAGIKHKAPPSKPKEEAKTAPGSAKKTMAELELDDVDLPDLMVNASVGGAAASSSAAAPLGGAVAAGAAASAPLLAKPPGSTPNRSPEDNNDLPEAPRQDEGDEQLNALLHKQHIDVLKYRGEMVTEIKSAAKAILQELQESFAFTRLDMIAEGNITFFQSSMKEIVDDVGQAGGSERLEDKPRG